MTSRATQTNATRFAIEESLKDVNTAIPGYVTNFDPSTQLAQVQIGIKRKDKKGNAKDPAPIIKVPVHFAGGSFQVQYQIDAGTEGLIIFSQRCIDAWIDSGGIAQNPIMRFHDQTDAFFIPGVRSQVNLSPFANDGIRLTDGNNYVWLKSNGDIELKGNNVNIESSTLTHNGTNIGDNHSHPQSPDSGGNTEQDTGSPQ